MDDRVFQGREAAALLRTVIELQTTGEARRFFRDLLTEDEIRMIIARWQVARALAAGRSYREIEEETGLSSRTIARISRWLQRGEGGYRLAIRRRKKETRT